MNKIALGICLLVAACNAPEKNSMKTIGQIERLDPALDAIADVNAKPEIIADGFDWSEGPLWIADQQMLLFSDIPPNIIYKWTEKGGKEIFLKPSGYTGATPRGGEVGSNGLLLNAQGKLVMCQHGDRRMAWMDAPLTAPEPKYVTIADKYQGKKLNSPNDAIFRSNGDLFFTDPPYGLEHRMDDPLKEIPFQGVYKVTPQGEVTLLIDSLTRPNGLAFLPGEKTLIVANSDNEGNKAIWYLFDIGAGDTLTSAGILYDATPESKKEPGSPDGLKVDKQGNIFATGPGGVWIWNKDRKLVGKIKLPDACSNIALADDDKTLYITNDGNVLRIRLRK
jgi:gluconolactonase